ncbi:methyl-accepting chemotaxis protein [Atopomonas hussainii]|uniref:Methyl-accepting chemotaxis protein n=1 Tax=Atopomonas hussainii TaxID=1429083 RepID=A0A1H7R6V1_9GAMM|nr:methyl-accepting chemotaxis protein [Atopomonas hussainii]SEL55961.1 methyl-accepting chemotaxis protein [Atopomonas hussainii]
MNNLRQLPIRRRLLSILLLVVVGLLGLSAFSLSNLKSTLYESKVEKTKHIAESALTLVAHYHAQVKAGKLSEDEAQNLAKSAVGSIRYGDNDYFWINDLSPKMVMHPFKADLVGKDLSAVKDPNGKFLFNEMVALAKKSDDGVVDYYWPKPGADAPVAKVSYIQHFQPWGWIIGTGVYVDDVETQFAQQAVSLGLATGLLLLVIAGLIVLISRSITRPLDTVVDALQDIASGRGDLTRRLNQEGRDEISALAGHFNQFAEKLQTIVRKLAGNAGDLEVSAGDLAQISRDGQVQSQEQAQRMEMVATAVNEVSYGVQDVAKNAEQAANEVRQAEKAAEQGQTSIQSGITQINELSNTIGNAVDVIQRLASESNEINKVLEVIRTIAEQTNLLALNAAIEAARAGEMGRGFAVVADEVRLLAQRTQQSTQEIQSMIEKLQSNSDAAVNVITESSRVSSVTVEQASKAGDSLETITQVLRNLSGLNASIASAILQQSHVVEDINRNVTEAAQYSHQSLNSAEKTTRAGDSLKQLADQVSALAQQFKA